MWDVTSEFSNCVVYEVECNSAALVLEFGLSVNEVSNIAMQNLCSLVARNLGIKECL
jgi:hypothetical protein